MKPEDLIAEHLSRIKIMQLATAQADEPWICTVHFYADADHNLYWISRENRHHSQQIAANPNTAATILVHENTEDEDWVTAITLAGTAEALTEVDPAVAAGYSAKLDKNPEEVQAAAANQGPAKFYRLKPSKIILFDTKNFPQSPRQEIII